MSGLELVGFIIGLEPLIAHGRDLIERYKAYKANRGTLKLQSSLTSFHSKVSHTIIDLRTRSEHLTSSTRDIIAADAQTLAQHLQKALQHASRINSFAANRVTQFLRANSLTEEFDGLFSVLEKADAVIQQARKFMEIMNALHNVGGESSVVDQFRSSFPAMRDVPSVLLQFDICGDDGNPTTVEGRVKKAVTMQTGRRRIVAIPGTAGVGKSTILSGLVRDELVKEVFVDGIHVIRLGMDATEATLFHAICKMLSNSGATKTKESLPTNALDDAIDAVVAWFRGRRCAFFLDDVCTSKISITLLSKFCELADAQGDSVVVITSREHEVTAIAPREYVFPVEHREPLGIDSRRILFLHADLEVTEVTDEIEESVRRILTICDGLPVSLAAAGKGIKMMRISMVCPEVITWKRYVSNLETCRERLIAENVGTYGNLYTSFAASIAVLDEDERRVVDLGATLTFAEMHRRFCVLQKQARVPVSMLKHLWETNSDAQAEMLAMQFVQVGLAYSEGVQIDSEWNWRMSIHDSLHDFAVMNAKQRDDVKSTHETLLREYRRSLPGPSAENGVTTWWAEQLSPDGYIHENVCRHLYEAGQVAELVSLLLTPEWTARRLEVNDVMSLEADFLLGIKAAQEKLAEKEETRKGLQMILAALKLSSGFIVRNPREVWFQLQTRLHVHAESNSTIRNYLTKAERFAKTPLLRCLSSVLVSPGGAMTRIFNFDRKPQCMTVLPGNRIVCGCNDGTVIILDLGEGVVKKEWHAHEMAVTSAATWSDLLVTSSLDSTAKLWTIATGACVRTFEGHSGRVTSVAVTTNGRVITGSTDGCTRVWNMDGALVMDPYKSDGPVFCVASLPDERVVSAGIDNTVHVWDQNGEAVDLVGHESWVVCLAVSRDGKIISGSHDGTVRIWNCETLSLIGSLKHTGYVSSVGTSNGRIVSGGHDCTIRVWDETRLECELQGHRDWVNGVCFIDKSVVSCSLDDTIRLWDIRHDETAEPDRHAGAVSCIAFAPDGRAITGSWDRKIQIWNHSGTVLGTLCGHDNAVTGVTVCKDGRIASVSRDRTLRIWDGERFEMLKVLRGHERVVTSVDSLEDRRVVTGSVDCSIRLWNLDDERCVVMQGDDTVAKVFTQGSIVIAVTLPGAITVYRCNDESLTALRSIHFEHAWKLGRAEVMELVGERTPGTGVLMARGSREIRFGALVLGSLESAIRVWEFWHDVVGLGMADGRVAFLKIVQGDG